MLGTVTQVGTGINREQFGLVVLGSGKVLAANGYNGTTAVSTAEIYDPTATTWSSTGGSFNTSYDGQYVVLSSSASATKVMRVGGKTSVGGADTSCEIFDSSAGTWSTTGSLSTGRYDAAAVTLNSGDAITFAGYNGTSYQTSTEKYSTSGGTWSSDASMSTGRSKLQGVIIGSSGKVYAIGGTDGTNALSTTEKYTP
jgi:hypothetical protein